MSVWQMETSIYQGIYTGHTPLGQGHGQGYEIWPML